MSHWEQFADMIATLVIASLAWVSSVVGPDGFAGSPMSVGASAPGQNQLDSIMRWAQQEDEPPIEQVGEGTDDVETLDEAAPPVEEGDSTEDIELLDQGPPPDAQGDAELLDQGPAPAPTTESPAPLTVTTEPVIAEPVTTHVAPATTSGPVVPEGFGTGSVHVATGTAGFPVGLGDCHVGAVTGRAFVGIDCGDGGGSSFVGHAPSFEEFPFVLDEGFPFDRESVFANRGATQIEDNVQTLFSAARGAPLDSGTSAPEIRTAGASSVSFEQRARDKKPRVEEQDGRAKRGKESRSGGTTGVTSFESQAEGDQEATESKQKAKKNAGKKSKSSNHAKKKHGDKKDKKNQTAT